MRLTSSQQQIIREASLKRFGVSARLFGSRVDDSKRGGDIDLYIEANLSPAEAFEREKRLASQPVHRRPDAGLGPMGPQNPSACFGHRRRDYSTEDCQPMPRPCRLGRLG